jgi:hypothetical protein
MGSKRISMTETSANSWAMQWRWNRIFPATRGSTGLGKVIRSIHRWRTYSSLATSRAALLIVKFKKAARLDLSRCLTPAMKSRKMRTASGVNAAAPSQPDVRPKSTMVNALRKNMAYELNRVWIVVPLIHKINALRLTK